MEPDNEETDLTGDTEHPDYDEVITTSLSAKERQRHHMNKVQILWDAEGEILLANTIQEYEDACEHECLNKPKHKCKKRV